MVDAGNNLGSVPDPDLTDNRAFAYIKGSDSVFLMPNLPPGALADWSGLAQHVTIMLFSITGLPAAFEVLLHSRLARLLRKATERQACGKACRW
eukprot:1157812-Pelagomonas_calceolata.AAC.3